VKKSSNKAKKDSNLHQSAEKVWRETQEHFRDFFENAPVGFYILGPDRIITDINEAGLAMTGYSRKQIIGKKMVGPYCTGAVQPETKKIN
jgi:PAS domain-containing protein